MSAQLNIDALRASFSRSNTDTQSYHALRHLSRRDFILLGTASAVTGPSILSSVGALEVIGDETRLSFALGGIERWIIDPRRFSGSPQLKIRRRARSIRISLKGALYPGTELPADLECELIKNILDWRLELKLALAEFQSSTSFERWLLGTESAAHPSYLPLHRVQICSDNCLEFGGPARIEFRPDWTLGLSGSKVFRLAGSSLNVLADRGSLRIPSPSEPSLLTETPFHRTTLALRRDSEQWKIDPPVAMDGKKGKLAISKEAFDSLEIELGEDLKGTTSQALVAKSLDPTDAGRFYPADGLFGNDGQPLSIPLDELHYGQSFSSGRSQTAVLAQVANDQEWAHANGISFQLGDSRQGPALEIVRDNDRPPSVRFEPRLVSLASPLPGALIRISPVSSGARMTFSWGPKGEPNDAQDKTTFDVESKLSCISMDNYRVSVLRREDFLSLAFEFNNLCLWHHGDSYILRPTDSTKPGILIVCFPPQSIAEQAFFEGSNSYPVSVQKYVSDEFNTAGVNVPDDKRTNSETPSPPPVQTRLSGESRLAFELTGKELLFTLESLLGWNNLKPSLSPLAQPAGLKPPGTFLRPDENPPLPTYTAIEFPYRLYLSPNQFSTWDHPDQRGNRRQQLEQNAGQRVELWHARLGSQKADQQNVRAIWSWDYVQNVLNPPPQDTKPFRMSTSRRDRHEIVHLSADYTLQNGGISGPCNVFGSNYDPVPIAVNELTLSSLGAWIDSRGAWPIPKGNNLTVEEWRHIATLGRDHYVRVVYKGYLLPFGHAASLVKITERKFQRSANSPNGQVVAYLRQRMYIVVRQPKKSYDHLACEQFEGRHLAFKTVEITSLVTPNLDPPGDSDINQLGQDAFWPYVARVPFRFQLVGEDHCNPPNKCKFTLPLVFIGMTVTDICSDSTLAKLAGVMQKYEWIDPQTHLGDPRRVADFQGQGICFADSNKPGDTQLITNRFIFGVESYAGSPSDMAKCFMLYDQPAFFPTLECAEVSVSSVQQLTGSKAPTWIYFHDSYLKSGFSSPANKGEVFAAFVNPVSLQFGSKNSTSTVTTPSDKSGGIATPSMGILGLSRRFGPVSGSLTGAPTRPQCWLAPAQSMARAKTAAASDPLADFVNGSFNPLQYFADQINARILGVISLADIIPELKDFTNQIEKVPQLISQIRQDLLAEIAPIQNAINSFLGQLKTPAQLVDNALNGIQAQVTNARAQAQAFVLTGMKGLQHDVVAALSTIPFNPPLNLLDAHQFVQNAILANLQNIPHSTLTLAVEDELALERQINAVIGKIQSELNVFADAAQSSVVKAFDGVDQSLHTCQLDSLITNLQNDVTNLDVKKLYDDLLGGARNLRDLVENAVRLNTLFPDGKIALDGLTQAARTFIQHFRDETSSGLSNITGQIHSDLQQIHDHANQDLQTAVATLQTQLDQVLSNLGDAVLRKIDAVIDSYIDKALDAVWPLVENALEAVQQIKETIAEIEQIRDALRDIVNGLSVPIEATARLNWKPELHNYPASGTPVFEVDNGQDSLQIDVTITTRLKLTAGQPSISYNVNGILKDFSVCLLPALEPFIKIHFDSLIFKAQDGSKPNIQANITKGPSGIQFLGVLQFVEDLEKDLQALTQGTGPFLEVNADSILAGLKLAIPAITVGAMSLQNIAISAAVNLPFTGEPVRFRFSFAEREHPCILTVGVFGGGFFIGLSVGLDGIEIFEGAFEFGGNFAFDVPAVSGAAYAMAGIYFRAEGQDTLITGYFRSGGVLDVFDIISIYLDIYLGLSYETGSSGTVVSGDAIVTISVEIGFFSIDVGFSYHKDFEGSSAGSARSFQHRLKKKTAVPMSSSLAQSGLPVNPQGVQDLMNQQQWTEYCEAFAAA